MKFIKDLFWGPGNLAADLGRIIAFGAAVMMLCAQIWNVRLGLPIDLGPGGLGGGLGVVMGGIGALIYAKDRAKSENTVAKAISDHPPEPPQQTRRK